VTGDATETRGGPLLHVVGARPNFPKLAPVWRALEEAGAEQALVHTGQHYDAALSDAFFDQLGLPEPDFRLGVGSGSHATQPAEVMTRLDPVLSRVAPRAVVLYGDINSTAAAALVAAKVHVDVVHVEAGLRSFDRSMPEEVNRVVVDVLASTLYATCEDAVTNLRAEGKSAEDIHLVGNPMIDTLVANVDRFDAEGVRGRLGVPSEYAVATIHRASNVDSDESAAAMVQAMRELARRVPVVLPLHPRGRARLKALGIGEVPGVILCEPLAYLDFLSLVSEATLVVTDSGGIQEESTFLRVPCLTMRPNTERPVTITLGTNRLVTAADLGAEVDIALDRAPELRRLPPVPLWDGHAGERIAASLAARS
jgi:UDP-N-acetylglucosamine 2-epimerase (non-hydrolysing)